MRRTLMTLLFAAVFAGVFALAAAQAMAAGYAGAARVGLDRGTGGGADVNVRGGGLVLPRDDQNPEPGAYSCDGLPGCGGIDDPVHYDRGNLPGDDEFVPPPFGHNNRPGDKPPGNVDNPPFDGGNRKPPEEEPPTVTQTPPPEVQTPPAPPAEVHTSELPNTGTRLMLLAAAGTALFVIALAGRGITARRIRRRG